MAVRVAAAIRTCSAGPRGMSNCHCVSVALYWCTGVLAYWRTGVLAYWRTGVLAYWCTGALVYYARSCSSCWPSSVMLDSVATCRVGFAFRRT